MKPRGEIYEESATVHVPLILCEGEDCDEKTSSAVTVARLKSQNFTSIAYLCEQCRAKSIRTRLLKGEFRFRKAAA
jgi:hypothetical protein